MKEFYEDYTDDKDIEDISSGRFDFQDEGLSFAEKELQQEKRNTAHQNQRQRQQRGVQRNAACIAGLGQIAEEAAHQLLLAIAQQARDAQDFAAAQLKVHVLQGDGGAECLMHVPGLKDKFLCHA